MCTSELAPALLEPRVQWQMQRSKQAVINYYNESNGGSSWDLTRQTQPTLEFGQVCGEKRYYLS